MITVDRRRLAAPCGIDCGNCTLYLCKDDPALTARLVSRGIAAEKLPCAGCRGVQGNCPVIGETCATYVCVAEKGVGFCFECDEFPCAKLAPAADRAEPEPGADQGLARDHAENDQPHQHSEHHEEHAVSLPHAQLATAPGCVRKLRRRGVAAVHRRVGLRRRLGRRRGFLKDDQKQDRLGGCGGEELPDSARIAKHVSISV